MGIVSMLKWFWDPRTDEQKAYDKWDQETPLQRRTQRLRIYIQGEVEPILTDYVREDWEWAGDIMRSATSDTSFNGQLTDWIARRGTRGIKIDNVWYSPESIVRIELGEQTLEAIQ